MITRSKNIPTYILSVLRKISEGEVEDKLYQLYLNWVNIQTKLSAEKLELETKREKTPEMQQRINQLNAALKQAGIQLLTEVSKIHGFSTLEDARKYLEQEGIHV